MHRTFNVKITSRERLEMMANINFCADFGTTPKEMLKLLHETTGKCQSAVLLSLNGTVGLKMAVKTLKTMNDRAVKQSFTRPAQRQLIQHYTV